jgi:hypothetical protein
MRALKSASRFLQAEAFKTNSSKMNLKTPMPRIFCLIFTQRILTQHLQLGI